MIRWILIICLAFCNEIVLSQAAYLKGTVINEQQIGVKGASVILRSKDSLAAIVNYQITGTDGVFVLDGKNLKPLVYVLEIRHLSYQSLITEINLAHWNETEIRFTLITRSLELKEVVINHKPAVLVKSDTISFQAGSYKNAETRKLEDLLKNINGFSVDANGRISFNGKAVEKVLIDGDDLADKGYRLITKNLAADIVDKVQVIDNYNDNRLMRSVAKSDKIGINIQTAKQKQDRFSGSITAGVSIAKRYQVEASLIYLGRPFKLLSFANANNIADDPMGTVRYHYAQESGQSEYSSNGGQYVVLAAGSISPPPVSDRYHKDNRDAALAAMSSWKIGKYTKMKALAGGDRLTILRNAITTSSTYISDTDNWQVNNVMNEKSSSKDIIAGLSLHRDALKNHISHIDVDIGYGRQLSLFKNLSSGDLTDTLSDRLRNRNRFFQFRWEENFLLKKQKLFSSEVLIHHEDLIQNVENLSTRFTSLYGVNPGNNLSLQYLYGRHFNVDLTGALQGRHKKWDYRYGMRFRQKVSDFNSAINFSDPKNLNEPIDTGEQRLVAKISLVELFLQAGRKMGRKTYMNIDVQAGYGDFKTGAGQHQFPEYKALWSYIWAISTVRSFRLRYTIGGDFSNNFHYSYPYGLISGNGNVVNGVIFNGITLVSRYSAGYHVANIYKNSQWNANLAFSSGNNQYNAAIITTTDYTISQFQPFDQNSQLIAAVSGDRFFSAVKSKLGASLSFSGMVNTVAINKDIGRSSSQNISLEGRWSTGLHFPVNLEIRSRVQRSSGTWRNGPANTNWLFTLQPKLKIKGGTKAYGAFVWSYFRLSRGNSFNGLDLFMNYRLNKVWKLEVLGNNLLNYISVQEKTVVPYGFSLTGFRVVRRYLVLRVDVQL